MPGRVVPVSGYRYLGAAPCELKFRVGERLAVVGKNGSGKTTFIKLLCRLYDPTEGEILLNGIDIRKYSYEEYLSLFSVVFQDFKLFSFELGQNVAASVEVDEERARACLEQAGFGTRLQELPKGLYTSLYKDFEEDGVEISGGEAQKIALARALYKDAPFLVLDEPTAALDPVAEYEVYTGFNRMVGNRTAVYISTAFPPAGSATRLSCSMRGRLCSVAATKRSSRRRTASTPACGTRRRSITRSSRRPDPVPFRLSCARRPDWKIFSAWRRAFLRAVLCYTVKESCKRRERYGKESNASAAGNSRGGRRRCYPFHAGGGDGFSTVSAMDDRPGNHEILGGNDGPFYI